MIKRLIINLTISLSSLLIILVLAEIPARWLTESTMVVKVDAPVREFVNGPEVAVRGADGSIAKIINWEGSGEKGVRLFPNTNAEIINHTLSRQDVRIRVNSYGLRGAALEEKQSNEFRILNLGDSITLGDYVQEEETIPSLLEAKLGAVEIEPGQATGQETGQATGQRIKLLNAGLPGASSADEYQHYLELSPVVKPDLVLMAMYLNDAQESKKFYAKTLNFPFSKSRLLTWINLRLNLIDVDQLFSAVSIQNVSEDWRDKFAAGRSLRSGDMLRTRDGFDFEIYNAHRDFGLGWNPQAWDQLDKIIGIFSEIVKQRGQKFAVYLLPVHMQIYANNEILNTYPQERFKGICEKHDLMCLDILPEMRKQVQSSAVGMRDLMYDHCHYKAVGNRMVSSIVAEWLRSDVLR